MNLFVSTTDRIEGYRVKRYLGLVSGQGVIILSPGEGFGLIGKSLSGGRIGLFEQRFSQAKDAAMQAMEAQAKHWSANAIIGASLDYEAFGDRGGGFLVSATGTAVLLEPEEEPSDETTS